MPAHQATPHGFSVKTLAETFNLPLKETAELVCLIGTVLAGLLTAFPALRVSPAYALLGALYFSLYQVGTRESPRCDFTCTLKKFIHIYTSILSTHANLTSSLLHECFV